MGDPASPSDLLRRLLSAEFKFCFLFRFIHVLKDSKATGLLLSSDETLKGAFFLSSTIGGSNLRPNIFDI